MTVGQWVGLGLVVVGLAVFFLARHRIRPEERRWTEHRSRHEMTDTERSLSERRW